MSIFSDNLKYLRESKNWSHQNVADKLLIKGGRYSTYESGRTEPPYELLIKFSILYEVNTDLLLTVNLQKAKFSDLVKSGKNRFLMPILVNDTGENLIEVVSEKAKAGYLPGAINQEYVEGLQTMSFPGLRNGKFRTFRIDGDSMSFSDQSYITGEYVENFGEIIDGKTYIIVTHSEGMTYKRLYKKDKNAVLAESDNPLYDRYEINADDIWEIWKFAYGHDPDDSKKDIFNETQHNSVLMNMFLDLKRDIKKISKTI